MAAPAVVVLGCWAKTSWVAPPDAMLNPALVPVRPPLLARGCAPRPVRLKRGGGDGAPPPPRGAVGAPGTRPPPGFAPAPPAPFPGNPGEVLPAPVFQGARHGRCDRRTR